MGDDYGNKCDIELGTWIVPPKYKDQVNPVCCLEFHTFNDESAAICSTNYRRCYI